MSPDGLHTEQQLAAIRQRASQMLDDMATCWQELLRPQLEGEGIRFLEPADYTPEVRRIWPATSSRDIWPVLTPLAFDPGHPFPHISNLSHSFAVVVRHSGRTKFARVKVPDQAAAFHPAARSGSVAGASRQARLVRLHRGRHQGRTSRSCSPARRSKSAHLFRIVRDTDMVIQEDEADDLLETVDRSLRKLRYGALSLLQVEASMPRRVLDILAENFEVDEDVILRTSDRLGFADWIELHRAPSSRAEGRAVCRAAALGRAGRGGDLRRDPLPGLPGAPSVRVVRVGGARSSARRSRTRTSSRSR